MSTTLGTTNLGWRFHGTISRIAEGGPANPDAAWTLAIAAIARTTDTDAEGVRAFLDSR